MLRFLRRLFGKRRLDYLQLVLYTRRGCHLCEDAWRLLERAQRRHHFELRLIDIDSQPNLAARYGDQVPVVTVNGQVRFHGTVNPVLLTRLLRAESSRPPEISS